MSYTIAGKKVLSEHLVLGVFGSIGAAVYLATSGGSKKGADAKAPNAAPVAPINASSPDEEAFVKQFLAEAMKEEK
ncbi:hypothetical protein MCAP1_001098 [Malassezia caprae]|uniref:ATP synthase subunit K, mitochondrial n=1 Tax=Malassezia caprae TaxID=1381934 RepID=A0AAF0E596_9BASI|nr:hypothetical protein MCAP1_001098 [Malassezia caprae]